MHNLLDMTKRMQEKVDGTPRKAGFVAFWIFTCVHVCRIVLFVCLEHFSVSRIRSLFLFITFWKQY